MGAELTRVGWALAGCVGVVRPPTPGSTRARLATDPAPREFAPPARPPRPAAAVGIAATMAYTTWATIRKDSECGCARTRRVGAAHPPRCARGPRGPRGGTHPSAAYGTHPSQPQQRLLHAPHSASGTRRARWLVPDTDQLTPCPAVAHPPPPSPPARAPPPALSQTLPSAARRSRSTSSSSTWRSSTRGDDGLPRCALGPLSGGGGGVGARAVGRRGAGSASPSPGRQAGWCLDDVR
jgi:hypothetical protein